MKLHVLVAMLKILEDENLEELDGWPGWDYFLEFENELASRFYEWGETLQAREICLECGQRTFACGCRSLHAF